MILASCWHTESIADWMPLELPPYSSLAETEIFA